MYRNKGTRLPASVRIQLYDPETLKKLGVDAKFTSSGTVWYRVLRYDDTTADTWKFSSQRGEIGKAFTAELTKAIESGATVGDLRRKVAEYRKVADVNRIRVYAEDGMRRGVLMGNDWVLDEIGRAWLCKWLSLDVRAEGRYVLLKGMRRKEGYVFHPTNRDFHTQAKEWSVKLVKSYMERDLFSSVGSSKLEKGLRKRMVLQFEGGSVGDGEKVKWGGTYELELPVDDAEAFNGEEAWLFSEGSAEACGVCGDEKKVDGFPPRITEACKHEVSICKGCLGKWLESSAEAGNWKRLKCPDPECKELLEYGSVKRYASAETFERYDRWMLNDALQGIAWFEWCLASKCDYGHIHDPACELFQCRNPKCGKTHCIKHHIFHDDETCQEYDRRQLRRAQENQRSEKVVKEMAKECPNCKRMVHKTQGCNHMTCTCRHEWCYICFAPFITAGTTGILLCHHNPGCTESPQPFAHLFDREGNLLNPGAQELRNVQVLPPPPPFANRRRPITQAGMRRQNGQRPHIAADGPEALPLFVPQPLLGRTALGTRRPQQQRRGLLLAP
ncbi:hypothetical protein QBC43DRAFT_207622 [Cladorrhinum sp. PSN259]|nr:hypothetical protein QBC43DRAFT_207622 [Cladorrhinum sp. PSN259]